MTQAEQSQDCVSEFEAHRGRIFGLAYRMLGSVAEAEDIVQETYLRLHRQDQGSIDNLPAWLTTVATRACLDHLNRAYKTREQYVGDWLPEPLSQENAPEQDQELAQTLSMAFLHLMERLNPRERAVFILRQAFDWSFRDIAESLGIREDASRQLFRRGQDKISRAELEAAQPCEDMSLFQEFISTCSSGNFESLTRKLADDVMVYSDSNGQARALRRPIHGAERVAHFLQRLFQSRQQGQEVQIRLLNGEPGLVVREAGAIIAVMIFAFRKGKLWRVYGLRNPEKFQALSIH